MSIKKIPVQGFVITCMKCGSHATRIETRQDGTDFQCGNCGNKLILRPGEIFHLQVPNPSPSFIKQKAQEFKKKLSETPMDDWPTDVIDKFIKGNGGE